MHDPLDTHAMAKATLSMLESLALALAENDIIDRDCLLDRLIEARNAHLGRSGDGVGNVVNRRAAYYLARIIESIEAT